MDWQRTALEGLKGAADMGTVIGNGLLLGQGPLIKGGLMSGGRKLTNALGFTEGDLSLKDAMQQVTGEIDRARKATGSAGYVAETAASTFGGLGLLKKGVGAVQGARALMAMPGKAAAAKAVGVPAAKLAGLIGTGGAIAGASYGMGDYKPEDFTDPASSSATVGANPGSKQAGPAAVEYTDAEKAAMIKQRRMDAQATLLGMSPNMMARYLEIEKMRPQPMKPGDAMKSQLLQSINSQFDAAMEAGRNDPAAQAAASIARQRALMAASQPSGVMYLPQSEE